jgi:hypothetical protein
MVPFLRLQVLHKLRNRGSALHRHKNTRLDDGSATTAFPFPNTSEVVEPSEREAASFHYQPRSDDNGLYKRLESCTIAACR